jgi:Tol biopolymer transport system component
MTQIIQVSGSSPTTPTRGAPLTTADVQVIRGRILFKTDRDDGEVIYVMNPDGSRQAPLRSIGAYQDALARESLSPDGKERLFSNDNADNWDIYMVPADGHKSPMAITSHAADDYDAVWSPAENLIAFVSLRTDGRDAIFLMTPDGRNDRQITFNPTALDKHPTWSPDGEQIAFSSDRDGRRQIYVIGKDGGQQTNISNNSFSDWDPIWVK